MQAIIVPEREPADLTLDDLIKGLTKALDLESYMVLIGPNKSEMATKPNPEANDYRTAPESQRDTSQADALEDALRQNGKPATARQIEEIIKDSGIVFPTTSKNPIDVMRQVLRKYPRFKQVDRSLWTLAEGFDSKPAIETKQKQMWPQMLGSLDQPAMEFEPIAG